MLKRIVIHVLGLFFIALGVRLMISANLGLFPMDAIARYLQKLYQIPIGVGSFILNFIIMVVIVCIKKNWRLSISIVNTVIFAGFLEIIGFAFSYLDPNSILIYQRWLIATLGFLIIALGTNFCIFSKLILAPVEFAMMLFEKLFKNLTLSKLALEACFLAVAFVFALIAWDFEFIGYFTAISILLISPMIHILHKPVFKLLERKEKDEVKSVY